MKKRHLFVVSTLLLFAASSMAMSLGRSRGVALVGRPLDMVFLVTMDEQDDSQNLCPQADVFYADNRLGPARFSVSVEKADSPGEALIRVRSNVPVDELVVSVYLRVGCKQKIERRYVQLVDVPPDTAPLPADVLAVLPALQTTKPTGQRSASSDTTAQGRKTRNRRESRHAGVQSQAAAQGGLDTQPLAAAPLSTHRDERTHASTVKKSQKQKSQPHLKLEPVDLPMEYEPRLKLSMELSVLPLSTPASSSTPSLIVSDTDKMQALQGDLRRLHDEAQKNQQLVEQLRKQLQKNQATPQRTGVWIYVLGILLTVLLAAGVYLWRWRMLAQSGLEPPWPWARKKLAASAWAKHARDSVIDSLEPAAVPVGKKKATAAEISKSPEDDFDSSLSQSEEVDSEHYALFEEIAKIGEAAVTKPAGPIPAKEQTDQPPDAAQSSGSTEFALSLSTMARTAQVEELCDVQRQVEFFMSLGQHEQAINVLRNHIVGDKLQTSAMAYLDLFSLYHQLERREDYELLRQDFSRLFNAQVPPFEAYSHTSQGLEAYETVLASIVRVWFSVEILAVLEELIFLQPKADVPAFSLDAYRELLLLYAVAKEREEEAGDDSLVPLLSTQSSASALTIDTSLPQETIPKVSPELGLDIDLSEPSKPFR